VRERGRVWADKTAGRDGHRPLPPVAARQTVCTRAGKAGARSRGQELGGAGLGRKRGRRPKTIFLF
jgi:hypothetical protein